MDVVTRSTITALPLKSKDRSPERGRAVHSRGTTPLRRALAGRGLSLCLAARHSGSLTGTGRRRLPPRARARGEAPRPSSPAVTDRCLSSRGSLYRSRRVLSSSPPLRYRVDTGSVVHEEAAVQEIRIVHRPSIRAAPLARASDRCGLCRVRRRSPGLAFDRAGRGSSRAHSSGSAHEICLAHVLLASGAIDAAL